MSYDCIDLNLRKGRIPYFNLKNKLNQKMLIKKKLDQFNNYLNTLGLSFNNIEIKSYEIGNSNKYKLNIFENTKANNTASICQTARDLSLMSERSYKLFRKIVRPFASLASLHSCIAYKNKVDRFWIVKNNQYGSYIKEPISKIKFVCEKFLEGKTKLDPEFKIKDNIFKILLSGDCLNVTKTNLKTLNFAFSLLNMGDLSRKGFFTLGVFRLEVENYEVFKIALKELINKLESIQEIVLNNTTYRIEFFFGGDLKWILETFGINAANSLYPCPWCTWKVKQQMLEEDINETFTIDERSHINAKICLNNQIKSIDIKKGYKEVSLFNFIEFRKVVVDILHMTLRITDKLFEMLLLRLEQLEEQKSKNLIENFKNFIENQCNITQPFYVSESKLKLRTLNQNERLKIFDKLCEINDYDSDDDISEEGGKKNCHHKEKKQKILKPLPSLFPLKYQNDSTLNTLSDLFIKFRNILYIIKNDNCRNLVENLRKRLKNWLGIFIKIEPKITPYIHIFCFHIPEFIEIYENLNLFSMQGLENLNSFLKLNYFRQTNRHKNSFTSILLQKMNRIEFYNLGGRLDNDIADEEDDGDDENNQLSDLFDFLNDS